MSVTIAPQNTFVRRYLVVMSVLILAAILATLALRAGVRAKAADPAATVSGQTVPATGELPVISKVSEFTLIDQAGAPFSSKALEGKIWVADFIFTSCASVCPVMTTSMVQVQRAFQDDSRVSFVSVSVDPVIDKPEVLDQYAKRHQADPARWHFLTGDNAAIQSLARDQFKLGHAEKPVNHDTHFVLVDGSGQIRGYYFGTEPSSIAALIQDISKLLSNPGA